MAGDNKSILDAISANHAIVVNLIDGLAAGTQAGFGRLEGRLDRVEGQLDRVELDVRNLQSSVARIETKFDRHESRIQALESRPPL